MFAELAIRKDGAAETPRPFKPAQSTSLLFTSIVFVAIDLAGDFILLMIYLRLFRSCQRPTVGGTVIVNFAINASVFGFQLGSFALPLTGRS